MTALYVWFKDKYGNQEVSAPGFHTFSLNSNTTTEQNNVPVSYDYTLNLEGTILYKIDPFSGTSSTAKPLYVDPENSDSDKANSENHEWLLQQLASVTNFFENKNFSEIHVGPNGSTKILDLGSGCIVKNLSFSDNNNNYWIQSLNYSAEISIPVTGGTNGVGGLKYLSSVTKPSYVSNIQDNVSISKTDNYFERDKNLHTNSANQYFGPEYTITRTISAVGKTASNTGSLFYAKSAVNDLYNQSTQWNNLTENLSIADRMVAISADEIAGSYTLTSTIIAYTGSAWTTNKAYINTYDVNISYNQELKRTVTIAGTMKGTKFTTSHDESAYLTNSNRDKYIFTDVSFKNQGNDVARFDRLKNLYFQEIGSKLYSAAQYYSYNKSFDKNFTASSPNHLGLTDKLKRGAYTLLKNFSGTTGSREHLNPVPVDYKITFNMPEQSIDYSVSFDNSALPLVTGARNEDIVCEESHGRNLYATHEIFKGAPVLQDLNTYGSNTRTVRYSANFPRHLHLSYTLNNATIRRIENIVDSFDPSWILGTTKILKYLTKFDQDFDQKGTYTMTKTWEW